MERVVDLVYDWLAANDVREWLPEYPAIVVGPTRITFTSLVWLGPPGWDAQHIHPYGDTIVRSVPLKVPPSTELAELLAQANVFAAWHGREIPAAQ
jgi:hypothetical protein